jgi:hypothetical protein
MQNQYRRRTASAPHAQSRAGGIKTNPDFPFPQRKSGDTHGSVHLASSEDHGSRPCRGRDAPPAIERLPIVVLFDEANRIPMVPSGGAHLFKSGKSIAACRFFFGLSNWIGHQNDSMFRNISLPKHPNSSSNHNTSTTTDHNQ